MDVSGRADRDAEQAEGLVPVGEGVALAAPFGAGLAVPHDEELLAFLPGACEEPGVPHERGDEQCRGDRLPVGVDGEDDEVEQPRGCDRPCGVFREESSGEVEDAVALARGVFPDLGDYLGELFPGVDPVPGDLPDRVGRGGDERGEPGVTCHQVDLVLADVQQLVVRVVEVLDEDPLPLLVCEPRGEKGVERRLARASFLVEERYPFHSKSFFTCKCNFFLRNVKIKETK